jgi:hypothetical protein
LLGRHIGRFAFERAGLRDFGRARGGLCDAEVGDFDAAVVADEDVRGRDVAVDNAEWFAIGTELLVRVVERGCGGRDDRDDVLERQLLLVTREVRE